MNIYYNMDFATNMRTLHENILNTLIEKMAKIKQQVSAEEYKNIIQKIESFKQFEYDKGDDIDSMANGYTLIFEKLLNRIPDQ